MRIFHSYVEFPQGSPSDTGNSLRCRENNTGHHMGCSVGIPSGYVNIAIENGTFIVDLAIKDGDFLELCKPLLEGTYHRFTQTPGKGHPTMT